MKVRRMMRSVRFKIHSNNDPEKAAEFWHGGILQSWMRRGNDSYLYKSRLISLLDRDLSQQKTSWHIVQ